jgi:peptide/nickel transport system substrate-binding protein
MKRFHTILATLLVLIVALAGFGPAFAADDTLIIGVTDRLHDLDTANAYSFHDWEILQNTHIGLLTYKPGTVELEPGLAADFPEVSTDGLEYTFTLREGLTFADGTPLTAEVAADSIMRIIELQGDPSWLVTSFVETAEAIDELTLKITLQNPTSFFPALVATPPYFPVNPNVYAADEITAFPEMIYGSGPYYVSEYTIDEQLTLEANEFYYGEAPKVPTVIVRYFADATQMGLALENGEIDMAWRALGPTDVERLREVENLEVVQTPGLALRYLAVNVTTPPFDNVLVRQAVAAAVDRDDIADRVFLGQVNPQYSMVPPGFLGANEAFLDMYGFRDLDMARELLTEAGYSEDEPVEFELWYSLDHYGDQEPDVAAVIKENLEETGMMSVTLQSAEWATYVDYFGEGNLPIYLLGWFPDYMDPDNYLSPFISTDGAEDIGTMYSNPEVDQLLVDASVETDQEVRVDLYDEIQDVNAKDVPTIPLWNQALFIVYPESVSGVAIGPTLIFNYSTVYFE